MPDMTDERSDETRLADPGRAGDSNCKRPTSLRIELADEPVGERVPVLDERDGARQCAPIAVADAGDERLVGPFAPPGHVRTVVLSQ
jgi:hypothetical protein